jgi:putative Holliday junction resolvase
MKMKRQQTLAFDYGRKRIGVATGQPLTATTTPLDTVSVKQNKPDWEHITRLIEEWQPELLLVGLPMNMDGTEHEMSRAARRFANQLNGRYQLPVELVDERLSSIEAEEVITESRRDGRIKKGQSKRAVDQVAAELIIRTWFSEQS